MTIGNGSIPQLNRGAQSAGPRALFHSVRDIALILDKTVKAGYGVLKAGTLMGVNTGETDGADYGKLVPYAMLNASAAVNKGNAKAYLVANYATGATTCLVTVEDGYKFTLGDHLIVGATGETSLDLGEITAIALANSNTAIQLTMTGAATAVMTLANSAYVHVKQGNASAPFSHAVYVLDQDIDTGVGADAAGALTSVVVSNAVLYKALIDSINGETAAYTDLGAVTDGRFVILK